MQHNALNRIILAAAAVLGAASAKAAIAPDGSVYVSHPVTHSVTQTLTAGTQLVPVPAPTDAHFAGAHVARFAPPRRGYIVYAVDWPTVQHVDGVPFRSALAIVNLNCDSNSVAGVNIGAARDVLIYNNVQPRVPGTWPRLQTKIPASHLSWLTALGTEGELGTTAVSSIIKHHCTA